MCGHRKKNLKNALLCIDIDDRKKKTKAGKKILKCEKYTEFISIVMIGKMFLLQGLKVPKHTYNCKSKRHKTMRMN